MRLPNIPSSMATLLMAAAIAVVTWLVLFVPMTWKSSPTPAAAPRSDPSITYVDINMHNRAHETAPPP